MVDLVWISALVVWHVGSLLLCCFVGLLVYWFAGLLVRCFADFLVRWCLLAKKRPRGGDGPSGSWMIIVIVTGIRMIRIQKIIIIRRIIIDSQ